MANTEDLGISYIYGQVAKMGFFFREQPKHDFGIDAHIETSDDNGIGTGQNIAVQIKSGTSYIKINHEGDVVHYTDERHIKYWAEHSLPVLLIVYDPEKEIAWWCDVKAYISRHPILLTKGPYKIILPLSQQFSAESKSALITLANVPQVPLVINRPYFSTISIDDISTNQAKRYGAEILVGNVSRDSIRIAIYQAIEHFKHVVEHSSDRRAKYWRDQPPHLITLFVYRDLDDHAHINWLARAIWCDPKSDAAKLVKLGKVNDYTEDVEIQLADDKKQEAWRKIISQSVISKYEFLNKVRRWISVSDELVEQAMTQTREKEAHMITEEVYEKRMSQLAKKYTKQVEQKYDDGTTGPTEVRDAEVRFVATVGSGGDVFRAFTSRGLEIWTDAQRRDYMVKSYLKRYKEDREMLEFELKKLGN